MPMPWFYVPPQRLKLPHPGRIDVRHWGSTEAERHAPYPADRYLEHPDDVLFRAVDVDAPADVSFRWLCQLRVAPYSYDLLDNFGRRSPRELTPGLDVLERGQRVMRIFRLIDFETDRHITLELDDSKGRRVFGDTGIQ